MSVYEDGLKVDQLAKEYAAAHGCTYRTALLAVMKGEQPPRLRMDEDDGVKKFEEPMVVKRYVFEVKGE